MKAVVLSGGHSSRFYPYSVAAHKSMVKIMGKPILQYCLEGLRDTGIKDIILRVSKDGIIKKYFGDGKDLGLSIVYIEQEESLGMGDVILKAAPFLDGEFVAIGGNQVNSKDLVTKLIINKKEKAKGVILVKKRENPWDYGIVDIKNGKLVDIVEKPPKGKEPSNLGLVNAFLLPLEIIDYIKKEKSYEFNFEEKALNNYAKENEMDVVEVECSVATLKYPWDLFSVKNLLMDDMKGRIHPSARVSKTAEIDKNVVIESGAVIMEGAKIKGPSYIGKNVTIGTNSLIRNGSVLEEGVSVGAFTEIKNSILMSGTSLHSGFIGDSIIGQNCKIGSGFTTANRKIDRSNIEVLVKDAKVDTGFSSFGVIVGDRARIGIKVSTMPGVVIGNNVTIGPSTTVFKNISDDVTFYAKFSEIVEKKS